MPKSISDFKLRISSLSVQICDKSYSLFVPHGDAQAKHCGTSLSLSVRTFSINSLSVCSLKLTFVRVVKSPSIISFKTFPVGTTSPVARTSPISSPVNLSCRAATSAFLPHTPTLPVQPEHPAVCSH